ncbi:hypothetical protein NDU88_002255 [Pleurodeles waltl]|uniref:Uncharacterized protein n=1 Tax=Pleurodeles waltl TaxID=8319 RepID=A0AAV7NDG2_PLEWA|nr:hypothetical protein NDU88_002255 [Pleurodeles waltl]
MFSPPFALHEALLSPASLLLFPDFVQQGVGTLEMPRSGAAASSRHQRSSPPGWLAHNKAQPIIPHVLVPGEPAVPDYPRLQPAQALAARGPPW